MMTVPTTSNGTAFGSWFKRMRQEYVPDQLQHERAMLEKLRQYVDRKRKLEQEREEVARVEEKQANGNGTGHTPERLREDDRRTSKSKRKQEFVRTSSSSSIESSADSEDELSSEHDHESPSKRAKGGMDLDALRQSFLKLPSVVPEPEPPKQLSPVALLGIQQQRMRLILHAVRCPVEPPLQCPTWAKCAMTKALMAHTRDCSKMKCPIEDCDLSRQCLKHWNSCTDVGCALCQPLREEQERIQILEDLENDYDENYVQNTTLHAQSKDVELVVRRLFFEITRSRDQEIEAGLTPLPAKHEMGQIHRPAFFGTQTVDVEELMTRKFNLNNYATEKRFYEGSLPNLPIPSIVESNKDGLRSKHLEVVEARAVASLSLQLAAQKEQFEMVKRVGEMFLNLRAQTKHTEDEELQKLFEKQYDMIHSLYRNISSSDLKLREVYKSRLSAGLPVPDTWKEK